MPFCYSCCGIIWAVLARPLLGLLYAFLSLNYSDPALSLGLHSCYLGFLNPFHCLRASSTHFSLLKHPWPIFFPWAQPIPTPHSHGLLLYNSITISFTHGVHGLSINPLLTYFITSSLFWPILTFLLPMGLLLLSLGFLRPACFLRGPFIILWAYDPLFLPFRLNGFSLNLLTLFCPYCWASSCYLAFPKWAPTFSPLSIWSAHVVHMRTKDFLLLSVFPSSFPS